jgi:flagellin
MAAVINTNSASLNAQRNLGTSQMALATSLQRLSSGLRINSAKDDAAGLAITDRMSSQIRGMDQAKRNANDGVSLAQTAEGALSTASDMLQRIRELSVQSSNATNSVTDRAALQSEANQLTSELDRLATTTQFNGQNLLDGTFGSANFQVGANANQVITATTGNFRTASFGNYRIGASVASSSGGAGDLTDGSTANAIKSSGSAASRVKGGDVTINGFTGAATISIKEGASAREAAALINVKSGTTNVSAHATNEIELTNIDLNKGFSIDLLSNNKTAVKVAFTTGGESNSQGLAAAIKAFNDVTSTTGVTAQMNKEGTGITLVNATGEDIKMSNGSNDAHLTAGGAELATATEAKEAEAKQAEAAAKTNEAGEAPQEEKKVSNMMVGTGQVVLDSNRAFGISNVTSPTDFFNAASASSQLQSVAQIDISSVEGASRAITQVDSALGAVSDQRSSFGALQARFSSVIATLQVSGENVTAARSRIMDTDFAQETASLTRGQILQQAGTAMLAQANQVPNGVLALLR